MKVFINPVYNTPDQGDGGIRRVVEAQRKHLPAFGVEVVDREQDADLVACHAGSYVQTSKPMVAHNHGLYWAEYEWDAWAHSLNNEVVNVLRRCDACTAPSDWVGYIIKRGMNLDAQTVYHGVDVADWTPRDKQFQYVLWNKTRIDPICDATPVIELAKRLPNVPFVTTFVSGAMPSNVRMTGRLPYEQAKSLVEGAAVYLATARETFGIGVLEAMASGAIVVGFDWGGQSEIIRNGENGILVKPYDYNALADAVQRALQDSSYAEPARERVREFFTWEKAAEQYAAIYERTLAAHRSRTVRTSVIITCYNLATSLPRAVNSVLSQDDKDVEVVIVNDASPDDTADVCERLAHESERVKVVTNASNLYLAGALDAGVRAASGRYVVPLDADNELAPGALATLANTLDTNQDVDIAYGSMVLVQEWPGGITHTSAWPANFVFEQQLAHRNQIPSTSMYRRKWHERAGGYRRRCRTAEDADFWCRVTSLGAQPRKVTEAPTLIYHERKESMSHVEADWDWTAWYPWGRAPALTPWAAPAAARKRVPSLEPAQVTVVIPVGPGHERYVADALDSLVAQTYVNWRCIVVDDRPGADNWTDPLILPPWVEKWITGGPGPAGGPARARNTGIDASTTPYFLLLDADDYLAPGALETLLGVAHDRRAVTSVVTKEYVYSDWIKQEEKKVYQAPDFVAEHLRTNLTHSVTALYPKMAWATAGGFDETLNAWEDWDFILKLIDQGYCGVHVPFPLLYYRYNTGKRREELYARRTDGMITMRQKWHKLMVEKAPMACGCSGGRTTYSPPVIVNGTPLPVSKDGMTLVQFLGTSAPRTYRGPSGKEYRFGSDSGHRQHYVNNQDLLTFANRADYRIAIADGEGFAILDAIGPPDREAELVPA